jgi:hypothetical protein
MRQWFNIPQLGQKFQRCSRIRRPATNTSRMREVLLEMEVRAHRHTALTAEGFCSFQNEVAAIYGHTFGEMACYRQSHIDGAGGRDNVADLGKND